MSVRAGGAALAAAACLGWASPALASFHLAHIERVLTGVGGSTDVQFVEIRMDANGQNLVSGSKLIAFKADGTFDHVVLTVPSNVTSGISGRSWLMASTAFEAASGVKPEFTFSTAAGNALPAESGMVCWGKPSTVSNPDSLNMIDCVSYGAYTGAANSHTGAPSSIAPFGHGLVRTSSTASSADDFTCEDPSTPHNNAAAAGSIDATVSCAVCGDGSVSGDETCDDGDAVAKAGDWCSAACVPFPCGIPTKAGGLTPKTGDALFVLKVSVHTSECDLRVCDVNDSGVVTTSDALLVLKSAVGQAVKLSCPALLPVP